MEDIDLSHSIMAALAGVVSDASVGRLVLQLFVIFALILINGFFAASEMAIVTLNDNRIRKAAE